MSISATTSWGGESSEAYLGWISGLSRMPIEEERLLVDQIQRGQRTMHEAMASIGWVAGRYLQLAQDIVAGKERFDNWILERRLNDPAGFRCRLSRMCDLLQRLFRRAEAGSSGARQRILQLLPRFCFKASVNDELLAELVANSRPLPTSPINGWWMNDVEFNQRLNAAVQAQARVNSAKQELVRRHLWLVPLMARGFRPLHLSMMDLVQEGNLGLIHAADLHDPFSGARFATYASWWIKQAIFRALQDKERLVRLPASAITLLSSIQRVRHQYEGEFGREASVEDLARLTCQPVRNVRCLLQASLPVRSIDEPLDKTRDAAPLADLLFDPTIELPGESQTLNSMGARIGEVLSVLNDQELQVIRSRYGLTDGVFRTMDEVARSVGLTRQRIQAIEACALKKLRHPKRLQLIARLT